MREKSYLTVEEVADRFGVNPTTVYRMVQTGKLPGFKLGGQWRFSEEALEKWVGDRGNVQEQLEAKGRLLEEAHRRLQELSRLKDEFVASVNHELRTPLTVVKEGVSLLTDEVLGPLNEKQKDFLGTVHQNIQRLEALIWDLLDLSKIEAGRLPLFKTRVPLRDLLEKALSSYKKIAKNRTLQLKIEEVPDVFADPNRVLQVIGNLFSNAVKFTREDGRITLAAQKSNGMVALSVQDDGLGIAPEDLPKLFQKFSQLGKEMTVRRGTGLGLALCKQLVEMHQGTIGVHSAPGKGSTFTFTLPVYSPRFALEETFGRLLKSAGSDKAVSLLTIDCSAFLEEKEIGLPDSMARVPKVAEFVQAYVHQGDAVLSVEPRWVVILAPVDSEGAQALRNRLEELLNDWRELVREEKPHQRLSLGIATYPEDGPEALALFAKATGASLNSFSFLTAIR